MTKTKVFNEMWNHRIEWCGINQIVVQETVVGISCYRRFTSLRLSLGTL